MEAAAAGLLGGLFRLAPTLLLSLLLLLYFCCCYLDAMLGAASHTLVQLRL